MAYNGRTQLNRVKEERKGYIENDTSIAGKQCLHHKA
jgi:hypothetical protein